MKLEFKKNFVIRKSIDINGKDCESLNEVPSQTRYR